MDPTPNSRSPLVRVAVLAVMLGIVVAACGGTNDGSTGISVQNSDLVAAGDVLYQSKCAACHGNDLRGTDKGPSLLSIVYEPNHHGDQAFVVAARVGVRTHHWDFGNMAPVEGLSDDDLTAIIAFVRETQRIEGFEPYPP
jgi:mono/diheme cytochrome c family protein